MQLEQAKAKARARLAWVADHPDYEGEGDKVVQVLQAEVERLTAENELLKNKPSGIELAAILVNEKVVDFGAVDDPDDYDGGRTLNAIFKAAEAVRG